MSGGEETGSCPFLFFRYQQRRGIDARPATEFSMRLWTVVAGAMAGHEHSGSKGMACGRLRGWNAGAEEASPSPVRNPDVGKNNHPSFTRRLGRKGMPVNPRPIADLKVRELAVVRRPTKGVKFSGFERTDDVWLVDWDAGEGKAAVGSSGKAVGEKP